MFGSPSTSGKTEASEDDSDQDFRKTPTESVHFYHFVATNSSNDNNNSSNGNSNGNSNSISSQDKKEDEKEAKRKTLRRQAIIQKRRSKK